MGSNSKHRSSKNLISDVIFSWSLDDIFNQDLFKDKMERIPDSFQSVDYYISSLINPLLEDIRAELCSKMKALPDAPFAQVISVHDSKPHGNRMYDVKLDHWRNSTSDPHAKELFRSLPGPGDIVIFAEDKQLNVSDLERFGRSWCFGYITHASGDDEGGNFKIRASKDIDPKDGRQRLSFVVFLTSMTTNKRIWDALHQFGNSELVKEVLSTYEDQGGCKLCPMEMNRTLSKSFSLASFLNETQSEAISSCLSRVHCSHKPSVGLIWGPPGTGKTRTVSVLLSAFLKLKCRTLICAPTNVAIIEVASRVVKVVRESSEDIAASVGDILLFGKKDQAISDVEDIHLDYRIDKLAECFGRATGWKRSFASMISFLEDYLSADKIQACQLKSNPSLCSWRDMFRYIVLSLNRNFSILCTHLSKSCILACNIEKMESLINFLNSIENLLFRDNLVSEDISRLLCLKDECLSALRTLELSLDKINFPNASNRELLEQLCFRKASLISCTASSSYKLQSLGKDSIQYLVIDEAAQLKECETAIPFQIPGVRHVVLIGNECQLTAMVNSKVSQDAGFGRSLFERLSILGHPRHLLDTQYRMHPDISFFPNSKFYQNRLVNALNVQSRSYRKQYLSHPMFGPYSFINIFGGKEVVDITGSRKNYVEVAVILKIVQMLHKACEASNLKITLGVVSPYSAQVAAIQQKLGQKFENHHSFNVEVRHSLWILGNERTLSNSGSIWEEVIIDAKVRQCFFHADEIKDLAQVIFNVKKELDQLEDLLNGDSALFRAARWKLLFSYNFRKSFSKLKSMETKRLALFMLSKLANGWRPRSRASIRCDNSSSHMLQQFKVGDAYIICSVDIVKESWYVQALKVWDILQLQDIDKLVTRLEGVFGMYTNDYLDRCKAKCVEGDLVIPITWPASLEIVQLKCLGSSDSEGAAANEKGLEVSKVRDSLLLMKFYSFSSGAVHNMISSGTGKTTVLTMKLFKNEQLYHMAVEGFHDVNSDDPHTDAKDEVSGSDEETKTGESLHQLFVTVSPKLCFAVNQHVSQLKRSICGGKSSAQKSSIHMDEIDETAQFAEIPDSFIDLPREFYPLIITFQKFLLMLDGTVGPSYFDRFWGVRMTGNNKDSKSRSVVLETFIRTKEVTYDKFDSTYWPHFNTKFTSKLDSCTVFTEIMSVIKGGLAAGDAPAGKLCQEDYVSLVQNRGSSLSLQRREMVYHVYLEYEKKKIGNGEFDMADLVLDLHHRLKDKRYEGDEMDFVYIDEVQDLSMRQIALFKYICKNVDEGFAFYGDTAQTIAKGIDFRFEDIRHLFYKEFLSGLRMITAGKQKEEKGKISRIFQLSQNFRTHAAVLKLAQSVINLLYHFFPSSIDVVSPETSLLSGDTPLLVRTEDSKSALKTIFEKSGDAGGHIIGFGAEQVILVRDECMKKEIREYVGKKSLVLTITECKGLEFQDVLLYNFFSSSSMTDPWRVIYGYMIEKSMLNSNNVHVANFNQEKHNGLCSEMKQLYVAITRAKQRLWIFDDCNIPMFEYWKKLCLVQERELDESFVKEMQVGSSKEDWMSRGIKLYYEHNYEMALMCFERAGDTYWERLAEASGLHATAVRFRASDSAKSNVYFKKAAELFYSIGKPESAAHCFFEIKDYKRAGMIYLENFGETKLEKAGECFYMANCFKLAAEAYAKARLYSKSLSACFDGKLFDMGFKYLESWKQYETLQADRKVFLHRVALHYFELKQNRNMMKFVKSFESKESMRTFLEELNCLDELLLLEEEWGNFLEAANIARLKKDNLREADLLEKAGLLREASTLIIWHVFSRFLILPKSRNTSSKWKNELLMKAKDTAKKHSVSFYLLVSTLAEILSKGRTIEEDPKTGLEFVQFWIKQASDLEMVKTSDEVIKLEQELLKKCARHHHSRNDRRNMMKYVELLHSFETKRSLLKALSCHDELLRLEGYAGNFLEAANVARLMKDSLCEADLLERAGLYREASTIFIWYVFSNFLSLPQGKYMPLWRKDELLKKAKTIARSGSKSFYEHVCILADILARRRTFKEDPEMGLEFVQHWKKDCNNLERVKTRYEVGKLEQDLLRKCACHFHRLNDKPRMMKYVEAFQSVESKRSFLKYCNCLDELLELEELEGNFLIAAEIAKQKGDVLRESDLLEKAGYVNEAFDLLEKAGYVNCFGISSNR